MLVRARAGGGLCADTCLGQLGWAGSCSQLFVHCEHKCLCPAILWIPGKRLGLTCDNTWGSSSVQVKSEKAFVSSEAGSIGALVAYCIFCNASVSQEWWFNKLLLALDKLSCGLSARCVCTKLKDCLCYKMLFVVLSYCKSILFCLAKCCYDLIPVKSVGQIVGGFFAWCKLH